MNHFGKNKKIEISMIDRMKKSGKNWLNKNTFDVRRKDNFCMCGQNKLATLLWDVIFDWAFLPSTLVS